MRNILHEIRNHLAVAVANVEAFRDGMLEPSPARLTAVLQALAEAESLLSELPRGASVGRALAATEPVDVCSIVSNEVLALEASARAKQIDFSVDRCPHPHAACTRLRADPLRVAEIVNNVVSNAIRYTQAGSRIDVNCHRADGALEFVVTDDGPGVAAGERERIFDAGFRGSASAPGDTGSGIGLALTKHLVAELGGNIEVWNVAGRGARFTVTLPGTLVTGSHVPDAHATISLL